MHSLLISPSASETLDFLARALAAVLLGALVGVERQWRQRMAGLRTNALVALGACLFVEYSVLSLGRSTADPTRIAAYVVSGVGFLGAGVILRDGVHVRGINTAATIWCSSAVGVLVGAGYVVEALIGALLVLGVNVVLRSLARAIDRKPVGSDSEIETVYQFQVTAHGAAEAHVRAMLLQATGSGECRLRAIESTDVAGPDLVEVRAELIANGRSDQLIEAAAGHLGLEPSVTAVRWQVLAPDQPSDTD